MISIELRLSVLVTWIICATSCIAAEFPTVEEIKQQQKTNIQTQELIERERQRQSVENQEQYLISALKNSTKFPVVVTNLEETLSSLNIETIQKRLYDKGFYVEFGLNKKDRNIWVITPLSNRQ